MASTRTLLASSLVLGFGITACHRKPAAPPPAPSTSNVDAERARQDSIARAEAERRAAEERARADREAAKRAAAERARAETAMRTLQTTIFFDYDRAELTEDARAALEAKVGVLSANPSIQLRVDGHTDERGSDEYNLALGQRRAIAAKRYLTGRGIADDRIATSSVGEEQPVCTESTESCWSRNRRDEFAVTAGSVASSQR